MEEFVHQTFVGKVIYTVMEEFVHQTFDERLFIQ